MYYLGIDLGGTNIACGLIDHNGNIIAKSSVKTLGHRQPEEILDDIVGLCTEVSKEGNVSLEEIEWAGLGSPGSIDSSSGVIRYANNVNFRNTNVSAYLSSKLNMDVYIDNDANCAAFAESMAGSAKGYKNSLTVTLGTGVGGGIIVDGKIFSGSSGMGGEIGHHVIVYNGRECTCGRKGCFEAYASATGLINMAVEAVEKNPQSKILAIAGNKEDINAKTVFDAADEQDETAAEILEEYMEYLGCGMANLINIFDPEIIVITGGISYQGEKLLKPLRNKVAKMAYDDSGEKIKLEISVLGNDAGIIGAAMLGRQFK